MNAVTTSRGFSKRRQATDRDAVAVNVSRNGTRIGGAGVWQWALLAGVLGGACTEELPIGVDLRVGPSAGAGGNGASGGVGGSGETCQDLKQVVLSLREPNPVVFIVAQKSVSMTLPWRDSRSRISLVAEAVREALDERRLRVGLVTFPSLQFSCDSLNTCCEAAVASFPMEDAGNHIDRVLRCEQEGPFCFQTNDSVPTAMALREVRQLGNAFDLQAAFLVTDGDPTCPGDPKTACEAAAIEAAGLFQDDVRTFVFPVGATPSSCLASIAQAGGTFDQLEPLPTEEDFAQALERAVSSVENALCQVRLNIPTNRPERLKLSVGGVEISPKTETSSSWFEFEGGSRSRIRLRGEICTALKRNKLDITALEVCCRSEPDCF